MKYQEKQRTSMISLMTHHQEAVYRNKSDNLSWFQVFHENGENLRIRKRLQLAQKAEVVVNYTHAKLVVNPG